MADKYTIRDFLVYFLTGLFLLVTLLYKFGVSLLEYFRITKDDIEDNSAMAIFLLVPGLYILGHIIHGIDFLIFKIGRLLWGFNEKYKVKIEKNKLLVCLSNAIIFIVNGNRVTGVLNSKKQETHEFWLKVSTLQNKGKFDKSEYWNLMNDLFKGLTLISLFWLVFYCYNKDWVNAIVSLVVSIVFWYRGRHMALNFISTVNNTLEVIDK